MAPIDVVSTGTQPAPRHSILAIELLYSALRLQQVAPENRSL